MLVGAQDDLLRRPSRLRGAVAAKWLTERGESLYHMCLEVEDIDSALDELRGKGTGGIEPTPYGRALIKRGVAVFDELRQGIRDIEFLADPTSGELRIGRSESLAAGPVLAVIDRLTRRYPRIALHVLTTAGPPLYRDLRERNVEIAISPVTGGEAARHAAPLPYFPRRLLRDMLDALDFHIISRLVQGHLSPFTH